MGLRMKYFNIFWGSLKNPIFIGGSWKTNIKRDCLKRKLFMVGEGWMFKNVGHHGWLTVKHFKITLAKRL